MSNKKLLIYGGLAVAGVALYFYWQKHKKTVVQPSPTQATTNVTPPASNTGNTSASDSSLNGYVGAITGAWDALSGLWGSNSSNP